MESDFAFSRLHSIIVLNPESLKDFDTSIIHENWQRYLKLTQCQMFDYPEKIANMALEKKQAEDPPLERGGMKAVRFLDYFRLML